MTKIACVRKIHFCSGHRVLNHEGKCANAHGHNYYAHIFAEANNLDELGRVIDFSVLKEMIGGWIDKHWDHNFLVCDKDEEMLRALQLITSPKKPFICPFNPTAENMAIYLLEVICPQELKNTNVTVTKVIISETDNCYAEATL
ncbi:queuosine biosynthesis protein QueD [Candidatus Rubidus massiliensis]|nr:MAG: 6-carboxy-5,6,7,8-tetrahydropterin synthase [Chlamydia sp. 32-24]CDZ80105.1 queuosine biosynthesis protein QueD [Candidatus Rubidus massiliensis]